ncbi:MAG: hypothetical protein HYV77_02410 [Candidatus Wildermuthbacteria bacterium]|nr:hypothetical protein [Candidatus Wildermuthbacteria bacterium]
MVDSAQDIDQMRAFALEMEVEELSRRLNSSSLNNETLRELWRRGEFFSATMSTVRKFLGEEVDAEKLAHAAREALRLRGVLVV